VTLEDIDSVEAFVEKLETIEPPSQLVSGLKDPLLQKYLMLNTSDESSRRLEFWLQHYFEEEIGLLQEGFGLSPSLSELLSGLVGYTETTKVLISMLPLT
jgi:centromere protein I